MTNTFFKFGIWVFGLAVLAGCGQDTAGVSGIDRSDLTAQIETSEFFEWDITNDDHPDGAVYDGGVPLLDSPETRGTNNSSLVDCRPIAWGRGKFSHDGRKIDIRVENAKALVSVYDQVSGILFSDLSDNGMIDPLQKPFETLLRRSGEFIRTPSGWRLNRISPLEIGSKDPEKQSVAVQSVRISVEGEVLFESSHPFGLFDVKDEVPVIPVGQTVLFEVETAERHFGICDPEQFVFLHYPAGPLRHHRLPMADNGLSGDRVAGDGVFSRTVTMGPHPGRHLAVVDVIAGETLGLEGGAYDAGGWGIPFRVGVPLSGVMEHLDIEGGCWRLMTDQGEFFQPVGEHPELYQNGIRVNVWGIPRPDLFAICQVGPVFEVLFFRTEN